MKWNIFQSRITLDETQVKKTRSLLDRYKDQYTELCLRESIDIGKSPVAYAAELKVEFPQMDNNSFNRKFLRFLSREREPFSNNNYIKAGLQFDLSTRTKINELLHDEQKRMFQALGIDSMLDIETGYDPFGDKLAEEIVKKQKLNRGFNDSCFFSKTFCILPWIHTFADVNGEIKLCCIATKGLTSNSEKPPLNLQSRPLREIWNSPEMRDSRRRMLAGEQVEACFTCDEQLDKGQTANREFHNRRWLIADQERKRWEKRVKDSINNDFIVPDLPVHYDIRPGNLCNLKCRMCHTDYSSLIQNDPVHSKWAYCSPDTKGTRFPDGLKWYESEGFITDELLENLEDIRAFYFGGGEPLINPFIKKLIDILIEHRVSHKISLEFSSNLTVFPDSFFKKLANFKSVKFNLSIDGIGSVYEYIRYPGKWTDIKHHLQQISLYPGISCAISATIQNYNVLSITDLLEYAESLNIPCNLNLLHSPFYLSVCVMPHKVRLLAAKRLKVYADRSPMVKTHPNMVFTINNVILELKQDTMKNYHEAMREFKIFTNDLDKSRNQSFKDTFPELYNFIIDEGFSWDLETHRSHKVRPTDIFEDLDYVNDMEWERLGTRLKLDESKAKEIKHIINRGKDQFTEICLRPSVDNSVSPVEYAARLKTRATHLDEDSFRKKLITYFYEKEEPVSHLSYLKAGENIDLSMEREISKVLSKKERNALEDSGIKSFLYIKTGYDPLDDKVSEKILNKIHRIEKRKRQKLDYVKDIAWKDIQTKLKLTESKAVKIRHIINRGKDQFTEVCLRPSVDNRVSPVEYAARLKTRATHLDEDSFRKKLITYFYEKEEPVSHLTYLEAGQNIDLLIERKIVKVLNRNEREVLQDSGVKSFLSIETGYDPLDDKILEQIQNKKIRKLTRVRGHKLKGFFCPFPFEYITVCDNGDIYLCSACRIHTNVGNLKSNSLEEIWNSENAVKIRESILDGTYRFCNEKECEFLQDHKLKKKEEFGGQFYQDIIKRQLTQLETGPRTIEISYDKSCNLSCPYCRQETFVCKESELARLKSIQAEVFKNGLKDARRLLISGCGDPLASSLHRNFLLNIDRERYPDVRIKLQTNGLLLTPGMWAKIKNSHYAIDWISISIDAATEKTYKLNRGGSFDKLLRNLEFVSGLRKKNRIETFNINFVVQADNFREMKQFIELGKRYGCDYVVFQRIMNLGVDYGVNSDKNFKECAVHLETHPMNKEFLEVLKNPIFMESRIGLFKLLDFFPEEMRKRKDVDSITKYYPKCERNRIY